MKQLLTQIVGLICDLVKSLWNLLIATVQKIWNAAKWRKLTVIGKILLTAFILACLFIAGLIGVEYYKEKITMVASTLGLAITRSNFQRMLKHTTSILTRNMTIRHGYIIQKWGNIPLRALIGWQMRQNAIR